MEQRVGGRAAAELKKVLAYALGAATCGVVASITGNMAIGLVVLGAIGAAVYLYAHLTST